MIIGIKRKILNEKCNKFTTKVEEIFNITGWYNY